MMEFSVVLERIGSILMTRWTGLISVRVTLIVMGARFSAAARL